MFLLDYATLPEEDIKLNDTTFSWPDRILPIISYSEMRLRKKNEQVSVTTTSQSVSPVNLCHAVMASSSGGGGANPIPI